MDGTPGHRELERFPSALKGPPGPGECIPRRKSLWEEAFGLCCLDLISRGVNPDINVHSFAVWSSVVIFPFLFSVLGIELRTPQMLGICSST